MPQVIYQPSDPNAPGNAFVSATWLAYPVGANAQRWLISTEGVVETNFHGAPSVGWHGDYCDLVLNLSAPQDLIVRSLPSVPPGKAWAFPLTQWTAFATINSIFDGVQSVDAGFAVDSFEVVMGELCTMGTPSVISPLFSSLRVHLGIRDNTAYLYRVGYRVAMLTEPVQYTPCVIE